MSQVVKFSEVLSTRGQWDEGTYPDPFSSWVQNLCFTKHLDKFTILQWFLSKSLLKSVLSSGDLLLMGIHLANLSFHWAVWFLDKTAGNVSPKIEIFDL